MFADADMELALDAVMAAKFRNAGQTCISVNRIYVQDAVYDDFAARLVERVQRLKVGNGAAQGNTCGPLINGAAVTKVSGVEGENVCWCGERRGEERRKV